MAWDMSDFDWGTYWNKNKKFIKGGITGVSFIGGTLFVIIQMAVSPTPFEATTVLTAGLSAGTTFALGVKVGLDRIDYGFTEEPK